MNDGSVQVANAAAIGAVGDLAMSMAEEAELDGGVMSGQHGEGLSDLVFIVQPEGVIGSWMECGVDHDEAVVDDPQKRQSHEHSEGVGIEVLAGPADGMGCGVAEIDRLGQLCGDGVVIAPDTGDISGADDADAFIGVGMIADEIAEAEDPVDLSRVDCMEDGDERLEIGVDIGDESVLDGSNLLGGASFGGAWSGYGMGVVGRGVEASVSDAVCLGNLINLRDRIVISRIMETIKGSGSRQEKTS